MELILRLADDSGGAHDVIVGVDRRHTVAELAGALADHTRTPHCDGHGLVVVRTGRTLEPGASIGDVDLLSGDELRLGSHGSSPNPGLPRRAVTADVLAGPESGRSLVMLPGRYRIGRSPDCDLSIDDASVSRHHADVEYTTDGRVVLHPMPETANGVTVNDGPVDAPVDVCGDDVIALGGTRLGFRQFERSVDEHVDRLGQLDFHRTPYRPPIIVTRDHQVLGPIPERPEPRRLQTMAMLAPLAGGLAMYAFSRQPQFLALTAVSPLVMIANVVEDRRSGRTKFRDQLAAFTTGIGEHRRRLDTLRHTERVERLRAAPDLADLSRRAELRTVDLWARGRDSPDFLRVRLGLGSTQVAYGIDLDRGGDDDLRDELRAVIGEFDHIEHVPVSVDLVSDPVLGIHGEQTLVDGAVASLAVQAATLHSPEDLTIVAAIAPDRPFGWLKWLPHVRSVASPLPGDHVVETHDDASAVISRLVEVATFRTAGARRDDEHRVWPRILLIVDGSLAPDPVDVSRLLEIGPAAGIAVIWTAPSLAGIPRQAAQVLDVRPGEGAAMLGHIWSTDPGVPARSLEVEHLRATRADLVARALAPVRDASTASLATSIPRTAPLLDVLGVGRPTARWVTEQWSNATGYELRFPIGLAAHGPLEIDLVENGPHSLIGGTSGAGKSELLQSMVIALAVRHPPMRLNFLFVDYKGGASSKVFERLPHTVGYVTNLSGELSLRALISLRAELNRRMQVMEGIAKDLDEMLDKAPDLAPPSLVIMVDEFATLVKEVPEFVAGIVDIAQRGRSLGIHLVLATQRPSNSVNENILANTNLRMSLRMLDRTESSSVIDSPDAADIPVPLKGRGFVRLGPRQLIEFQSSFAGAPLVSGETRTPVLVAPFDHTDDSPRASSPGGACEPGETHLSALLDAISAANDDLAYPTPRRPWRDVLESVVALDAVADGPGTDPTREYPGRFVTFGMLDAPETQEQRPAVVDLEEGGGWLVFGSGGSGKTTLLRTVATSISEA
ncbi:MAG: FtsK/SpoIIIE domain-containing protein, partial [Ilumatobacter sp.]